MSLFGLTALEGQPLIAVGAMAANGRHGDRRRQLRSHIPAAYTVHMESNGVRLKTLKAPIPVMSFLQRDSTSQNVPIFSHTVPQTEGQVFKHMSNGQHCSFKPPQTSWVITMGMGNMTLSRRPPIFHPLLLLSARHDSLPCPQSVYCMAFPNMYNLLSPPSTFPSFPSIKVHSFLRGKKKGLF